MPKRQQAPQSEEGFQTPLTLHLHAAIPGTYRFECTVVVQEETWGSGLTSLFEPDPLHVAPADPRAADVEAEGEAEQSYDDEMFARRVLEGRPRAVDMVRLMMDRPGIHTISGLYHLCTAKPYEQCRLALATTLKGKPNPDGKKQRAYFDRHFGDALEALRQLPGWLVEALSPDGASSEGAWSVTGGEPTELAWRFDAEHDCQRHQCAEHRQQMLRLLGRSA